MKEAGEIIGYLLKACQDKDAQIATLAARVKELEQAIAAQVKE